MKLEDAVAAIRRGERVISPSGSMFWLEHDAKGRPVLMGRPHGFGKPVRNLVLASEHFTDEDWQACEVDNFSYTS